LCSKNPKAARPDFLVGPLLLTVFSEGGRMASTTTSELCEDRTLQVTPSHSSDSAADSVVESTPSIIDSIPPAVASERKLGIQVTIAGTAKDKLDVDAAKVLQTRGEALLADVVLEGRKLAAQDQPRVLDPKVRLEDIERAFDHTARRFAQEKGNKSRFLRFLHELPILLSAVALTKGWDAWKEASFNHMAFAFVLLVVAMGLNYVVND
jgi:hypothetical protein